MVEEAVGVVLITAMMGTYSSSRANFFLFLLLLLLFIIKFLFLLFFDPSPHHHHHLLLPDAVAAPSDPLIHSRILHLSPCSYFSSPFSFFFFLPLLPSHYFTGRLNPLPFSFLAYSPSISSSPFLHPFNTSVSLVMWFSLFHTFVSLRVLIFLLNDGAFSFSLSLSRTLTLVTDLFRNIFPCLASFIFVYNFSWSLFIRFGITLLISFSLFVFCITFNFPFYRGTILFFSFTGSHFLTAFSQQQREDSCSHNAFRQSFPPIISQFSNQQQEYPQVELNYVVSISRLCMTRLGNNNQQIGTSKTLMF